MLDNVTLDQLRTFIAAVDTGSFSAAGRRLGRAQSVVSQTLANLEDQLGIKLFDRVGRYPVLTDAGRVLLADARVIGGSIDGFKSRARVLAGGLEPELSVVINVLFPLDAITNAVTAFHEAFPETPLRLFVESFGAVLKLVADGRCAFGVQGQSPPIPVEFARERLQAVRLVTVVSPRHPLAAVSGPVPKAELARYNQLVLSDRTEMSQGQNFGVFTDRSWHLADLGAKHAFLRSGLGYGNMPMDLVGADLASGTLVRITIEDETQDPYVLPYFAVYPADRPPGPAGRWFIDYLSKAAEVV